jgi:hypothetical protein
MEDVGAAGKLGDLDLDLGTLEDPSFYFTLQSRRKFLVTIKYNSTAEHDCQIGSFRRVSRAEPHLNALSSLLLFSHASLFSSIYIQMTPNKTETSLLQYMGNIRWGSSQNFTP